MKILHVITKSKWGGAQRYVYDLAVAMKEKGHSVVVAAGGGGPLLQKLEEQGVSTYAFASAQRDVSLIKDIKTFLELTRLAKKTNADIIHVNSSKLGGIGAVVGFLLRKKTVFTAHGWPFQEKRNKLATVLIWLLSWLTGLFSSQVIVPSMNDFRLAQKMPLVGRKTRLVYLGREVEFFDRETSRRRLLPLVKKEPVREKPWIGVVAELHPNKGHRFLLEVARSIEAQFFFVGEGELRAELEKQVNRFGLDKKVFFLSHVDGAASYLRAFDCLMLPSLKEGLPYTIIEAGLAGVPVLASRVGGVPEIVTNQDWLVEPGSVVGLTKALDTFLAQDEYSRKTAGLEFEKQTKEKFSREHMVDETLKIYRKVLDC